MHGQADLWIHFCRTCRKAQVFMNVFIKQSVSGLYLRDGKLWVKGRGDATDYKSTRYENFN
jgi:hypothetical protein